MAQATAVERTRQAITAIQSGDIPGGRTLLAEALAIDSDYELAWLWFAAVVERDEEKKYCLQRAREANPLQEANAALGPLRGVRPEPPPEVTSMVDPDPPDFVRDIVPELVKARRRRRIRLVALVVSLFVLLGVAAWGLQRWQTSPIYFAVVVAAPDDNTSEEIQDSVNWAVRDWNDSGRAGNNPLQVEYFYDDNDPVRARDVATQIAADDRFVAVLGHQISVTSEAAGPIYQQAGIPVVTSTATSDAVTRNNDWYFRTVFSNAEQGEGMAAYVSTVLREPRSIVVSTVDSYGITLRDSYAKAIEAAGKKIQANITVPARNAAYPETTEYIVDRIMEIPNPGPIILMVDDPEVSALGPALEEQGLSPTLVGSDGLADRDFFGPLAEGRAGLVNRALAASPLTRGALAGEAVLFVHDFSQYYGYTPSWVAPLTYDAVNVIAESSAEAEQSDPISEQRQATRDRMTSARNPQTAFEGVTGSVYFDRQNSANRPVGMESGRIAPNGELTIESAPIQLAPYSPAAGQTAEEEIFSGNAVRFLGTVYTLQQIVAVGMNFNQIEDLNVAGQTFYADFFIWFKYAEGNDDPTDVSFSNSADAGLRLGEPERLETVAEQTYALYRVTGDFKAQFNFRDFPFDTQVLPINLQHNSLPSAHLSYFPDDDLLDQSQAERLESGVDSGSTIDAIPNWTADKVEFFPSSVGNTATLGDPYFVGGSQGITFSVFSSTIDITRDVSAFLVKNLLPLFLLAIVVYISLWLPFKDHTARVSMAVTGVLTGAVMLNSVTTSLPSVDYTVAIEWAYYVFIALAASTVVVTLVGRRWNEDRRLQSVRTLNIFARVGYPMVIVLLGLAYWWVFS